MQKIAKLGGTGTSFLEDLFGRPIQIFKKLEEIDQSIKDEYVKKADGTKLVLYSPQSDDADKNGFKIMKVYGAFIYNKKSKRKGSSTDYGTRILAMNYDDIVDGKRIIGYQAFIYNNGSTNLLLWTVIQNSLERAFDDAKEGTEFKGWMQARCYKLTMEEVSDIIKDRIFTFEYDSS